MTMNEKALRKTVAECAMEGGGPIKALKIGQKIGKLEENLLSAIADEYGLSVQQLESVCSFYPRFSGGKSEPCALCTVYDPDKTGEKRQVMKEYKDLDTYIKDGGYRTLTEALQNPNSILESLNQAGVVGRSGSGFPVGVKWKMVKECDAKEKYVVMNGAEGEPGTGKDRALITTNPYGILEGISLCAVTVGAQKGYVYIRDGYEDVQTVMENAIAEVYSKDLLGANILNSGFGLDIEVVSGAGCYVCGEETGLIEMLEGKRGEPRSKPPYPGKEGLWGAPTVINNAETFANTQVALMKGTDAYRKMGTEKCPGTKLFTVSGCVKREGVYEFPFGITARQLYEAAGGSVDGKTELKGFQLGGNATGTIVGTDKLDVPLDIQSCMAEGMTLGTGAIRFIGVDESIVDICEEAYSFLSQESCGKCVPCRLGNREILRALNGERKICSIEEMVKMAEYIGTNSLCGLGQAAPTVLQSAIRNFREEFETLLEREGRV